MRQPLPMARHPQTAEWGKTEQPSLFGRVEALAGNTVVRFPASRSNHRRGVGSAAAAAVAARFELLWDDFGYKMDRTAAFTAWERLEHEALTAGQHREFLERVFPRVLLAARIETARRPLLRARGNTPIYLQGWITRRRWESELYDRPFGIRTPDQQQIVNAYLEGSGILNTDAASGHAFSGIAWTEQRAAQLDAALAFMPVNHWARAFAIVNADPTILERLKIKTGLFDLVHPQASARLVDELTRLAAQRGRNAKGRS